MQTQSNENILATRQKFFFRKVAPVQSITDIVLLDFWLMLLSWMFISFYTTIYFFVKKFIFSNVCIFMNTIFESLYIFFGWEREHQLSTYATGGGRGWVVIQNAHSCVQEEGVLRVLYFVLLNLVLRFLQIHRGEGDFSMQKLGLFFQS